VFLDLGRVVIPKIAEKTSQEMAERAHHDLEYPASLPEPQARPSKPAAELTAARSPSSVHVLATPCVVAVVALGFAAYPPGAKALLAAFTAAVLVVIAAIDLESRIVPNRIVLPAATLVLVGQVAIAPGHATEYVLAALIAAIGMFLPRLASPKAIGMGDVKLALLLGAALGWNVAWALVLGFVCVFPVAVVMLVRGGAAARKATIPMAPFLALGALIVLLGPGLAAA
jgi:prepilin signal peptidase PulO-like enzyme (type II secretory pathway)